MNFNQGWLFSFWKHFLTLTAQIKILILSFNDIEFTSNSKHSSDPTPVLISKILCSESKREKS